jgi:hypothetical protein
VLLDRGGGRGPRCATRGLPHVTLDLREEFRDAGRQPFTAGYAAGRPNRAPPVTRVPVRRASRLRAAGGAGEPVDGSLRPDRGADGCLLVTRGGSGRSVLHAVDPRPAPPRAHAVRRATSRRPRPARPRRAGLSAATRSESQEACFLAGGTTALPRAAGPAPGERPHRRRAGRARDARRLLALHAGGSDGLGVAGGRPLYVLAPTARPTRSSSASRSRSR